jgi:polyhydroxybutyrate depolymerase
VCTGKVAQPLDDTWTLNVSGTARTLHVHVPASYDPATPMPVVLNFHGFTSNAAEEDLLSGMSSKADASGFIAVHPEGLGTPQSWNAGACCGYATANGVDDMGFVTAMLDQLEGLLCVDTHRVFATGMSNGGFFSHRLACELSTRIAAVAPVAGVLGEPTCNPTRPVPVMEFHGTLDPLVPYGGDPVLGFPPVPQTFTGWSTRDGCTGTPTDTFDDVDSHCSTYSSCSAGAVVTLCTVDGGGHTWPGGLPVPALGYTTPFLSATDAMWTFFQAHPLP